MALCVDEYFQYHVESKMHHSFGWNKLQDVVMFTSYDAFAFHGHSFYFRMINKVINRLISTGIMKHLIENHYTKKSKFVKVENGPEILNLEDVKVCFNIWIGCCVLSCLIFLLEQLERLRNKRLLHAQIHPEMNDETSFNGNIEGVSNNILNEADQNNLSEFETVNVEAHQKALDRFRDASRIVNNMLIFK